jgi:dihydrofolate reductase
MKLNLIVAFDANRCIGNKGGLPWPRLESDLPHFRQTTIGKGNNAVIMGRKTWDSLPSSARPLVHRKNIVVSRDEQHLRDLWLHDDIIPTTHIGGAVAHARHCDEAWIIGGADMYKLALDVDVVDEMHITQLYSTYEGDVFFPKIPANKWRLDSNWQGFFPEFIQYRLIRDRTTDEG